MGRLGGLGGWGGGCDLRGGGPGEVGGEGGERVVCGVLRRKRHGGYQRMVVLIERSDCAICIRNDCFTRTFPARS